MLAGSIANTKLLQIASAGCVTNAATTATNLNTANAIVARDANGDFCAGTITANLNGNASTVTTIPALTGHVTSTGTNNLVTTIGNLCVTNNMIVNATIANCKTTATAANTPSKIVCRDANKDFCAGTITATLAGNATTVTTIPALTGHVTSTGTSNATTIAAGVVTNAMLAAGSISPSKTNATLLNTANTIILRQSTTSSPPIISSIEFQPLTTAPTSPTMGTVYVKFVNNQFAPKTLMIYTCYPDTSTFPATMTPGFYQVDSY